MRQPATMETQRARLAHRLRPLYVGLRSDEFDRMVTRIAEIELYGTAAEMPDVGDVGGMQRVHGAVVPARVMAS